MLDLFLRFKTNRKDWNPETDCHFGGCHRRAAIVLDTDVGHLTHLTYRSCRRHVDQMKRDLAAYGYDYRERP